jgi:hypothetical protein
VIKRKGGARPQGEDHAAPTFLMTSPTSCESGEYPGPEESRARGFARRFVRRFFHAARPRSARRVLFLDDDPVRAAVFLRANPEAVWVETVETCIGRLPECWDEVHLDHDLGGKTHVDTNQVDCGMEVIRWICSEPRTHLYETRFFVHTHNSAAGLLMELQMRASGYNAELRPFGVDLAGLLGREKPPSTFDGKTRAGPEAPWQRWLGRLRCLRPRFRPVAKLRNESE